MTLGSRIYLDPGFLGEPGRAGGVLLVHEMIHTRQWREFGFLGFVDEATKLRLLRESTANVFPSPKEGWGITVMEAAACGTPSLASDSPGLRDSVRDGETGWLVPHGSPEPLAARMVGLALDPGLVERFGAAARRWAEGHSWEGAAAATLAHLQDLVQARPHT